MKTIYKTNHIKTSVVLSLFFILFNCSGSDNTSTPTASITVSNDSMVFGEIEEMNHSESQILNIQAANLAAAVQIEASPNFEVSLDDTDFTSELSISNFESLNLYVRFSPQSAALGLIYGTVRVKSTETTDRVVSLSGIGFSTSPSITTSPSSITFQDDVAVGTTSISEQIIVTGQNLTDVININITGPFKVSLDGFDYSNSLQILSESANGNTDVYIRFTPEVIGSNSGIMTLQSTDATDFEVNVLGTGAAPSITTSPSSITFQDDVAVGTTSISEQIIVTGQNLTDFININITGPFKISLDGFNYSNSLQILSESANGNNDVYIRFTPEVIGSNSGIMTLQSTAATDLEVYVLGTGAPIVHNYTTFNQQALGFGGGFSQSNSQVFNLHQDTSNVAQIKMFLQIDCPSTGCDDWDRFANIKVKDDATDKWFEIGRYITPYWVGTQQLDRGLEFDVTDFKDLLSGPTELRIYIENWTAKADLITLEFDYIEGTPDYPYYAVSEVLGFHANSIDGVPYGVSHSEDLDKTIQIPNNAESAHLRTLISGWGHATPTDSNGRPCAEWCYRTHAVKINGVNSFQHYMGPIGCASNPVTQSPGNWTPDRAGWCPGMAVPVRSNDLGTSFNGTSFTFEYDYEDWTSDGGTTSGQNGAYYATSTYVVVKSNTEISSPVVN